MERMGSIPDLSSEWGGDIYPLLSWCKLEQLKKATVMVVGCGALGNEVLKNLALFGVSQLVIVDFDIIEQSNLTRSILFTQDDAEHERDKVKVAARRIREINPAIRVLPIKGDITHDISLGLIRRMDVVIGCLDNRWARFYLNRLCMRAGVPWVDGGIDGLEGTARVFMPGKNCYACNLGPEALKDLARRVSCSSVIRRNEVAQRVATTPIVASIIGAVEAQEAIKLLHPDELAAGTLTSLCGKMFYYEGQHLSSRLVDFTGYDEECAEHECWQPLVKTSITNAFSVREALMTLSDVLEKEEVSVQLFDHCFVDYIVKRETDERYEMMCPNDRVAARIEEDPVLRFVPFHAFYQHEIRVIDRKFPYPELTLKQLGIPSLEILAVSTESDLYYVELAGEPNDRVSRYLNIER